MLHEARVAELMGMRIDTADFIQQLMDACVQNVLPRVCTLDRHVIVGKVYSNPVITVVMKLIAFGERRLRMVMRVLHLVEG